jgi:hypothetical protein
MNERKLFTNLSAKRTRTTNFMNVYSMHECKTNEHYSLTYIACMNVRRRKIIDRPKRSLRTSATDRPTKNASRICLLSSAHFTRVFLIDTINITKSTPCNFVCYFFSFKKLELHTIGIQSSSAHMLSLLSHIICYYYSCKQCPLYVITFSTALTSLALLAIQVCPSMRSTDSLG